MIKKICVLGGGTSGFFTAAILAKYAKNSNIDLEVKCIYSSKIGIIGVGESTVISINDALQFLELKDEDWMAKCNATYKTNIAFESWSGIDGDQFFYPFGDIDANYNNFFDISARYPEEVTKNDYSRYAIFHSRLAEYNRLTDQKWDFDRFTAYHFDTHLLSKVLYEHCEKNGVIFHDDEYLSSHHNDSGIEYIFCKESGKHYADLFVDCTGFKSLLLGKEMGATYETYSNTLINNRALICKVPYSDKEEQLKNYTNNVAMENGWCWEIPLWDGMSLGYVHSLKFSDKSEILKEFQSFVGKRYCIEPENIKELNFITGRYKDGWIKNVVAVGLSYGFIEPLESTGIHLGLNNVLKLLEVISMHRVINSFDRKLFNYSVGFEIDRQKSFIDMHYAAAHKCDTKYWNYITNENEYDWESLNCKHSLNMTMLDRDYSSNFYGGLPFILSGNGYSPYNPGLIKRKEINLEYIQTKNKWKDLDNKSNEFIKTMKSTYKFLQEKIYSLTEPTT